MDSVPLILFWLAAVCCLAVGPTALIYLLFISVPFGAFAVMPPAISGGMTLTPAPMAALLLTARVFFSLEAIDFLLSMLIRPRRLTLLLLFWIAAVITTLFMPRLFARAVEVVPLRVDVVSAAAFLEPTTQNLSQLVYMTISVFLVCAFTYLFRDRETRRHAVSAVYVGAAVMVVSGALDYANQFLPLDPLLEPFRTASYSLITDAEILGGKRVVGLMPEASAFGGVTITFLTATYFFRRTATHDDLSGWGVRTLLCLLGIFVWLSTSSAAYAGLLVFLIAVCLEWLWRGLSFSPASRIRRGMTVEFSVLVAAAVTVGIVTLLNDSVWAPFLDLLDQSLLQKNTTSSFEERGMWTSVSWHAFLETYGLGVGLGGTRASNSVVSMLSNVGIIGGLLYYGFVSASLLRPLPLDEEDAVYVHASRWAFLAPFATSILAATTPDFGVFNAWLFAMALSGSHIVDRPRSPAGSLEMARLR